MSWWLLLIDSLEDIGSLSHDEGDLVPPLSGEKRDDLIEFPFYL